MDKIKVYVVTLDKINFDAIPIENDIAQVDMLIDNLPIKIPIINSL